MNLAAVLQKIQDRLTGYQLSQEEIQLRKDRLPSGLMPDRLADLLMRYPLSGTRFLLSEDDDESHLGVDMRWMTPHEIIDESLLAYPGVIAVKEGYLPIGKCMEGSGDPYFSRMNASGDPQVVRVPHGSVDIGKSKILTSAIEVVSESLSRFFHLATIE